MTLCKQIPSLQHPCNASCRIEIGWQLIDECTPTGCENPLPRGQFVDVRIESNVEGTEKKFYKIFADGNCGTYEIDVGSVCCAPPCEFEISWRLINCPSENCPPVGQLIDVRLTENNGVKELEIIRADGQCGTTNEISDTCCDFCTLDVSWELIECATSELEEEETPPANLPQPRIIACSNSGINSSGNDGIQVDTITGLSAGAVDFKANAYAVPDRFIFYEMVGGIKTQLYDTGYISSCSSCTTYNTQLADTNGFTDQFKYQYKQMFGANAPAQGLIAGNNITSWTSFTKLSDETDEIIVEVWGPLKGTIFDYFVRCNTAS